MVVTEQSRDGKCSTGNTVSNILTTVRGARPVGELSGPSLSKLYNV